MKTIDREIADLVSQEGLDDFETLLTPREWDEVPFVSRLHRIGFLSGLDITERSSVLLKFAVQHFDRIVRFAEENHRDVIVLVSLANWEELQAEDADPIIPNFWISTNPQRDLASFRLVQHQTAEAALVARWLESADLLRTHEVFDSSNPSADPELRRVYVAQRDSATLKPFIIPP